ncbi:MAG: hypothetical protein GWP19_03355 [Planctomycetia bacterium]|nr:hypothetical protein [Planctomycetia bacterium]
MTISRLFKTNKLLIRLMNIGLIFFTLGYSKPSDTVNRNNLFKYIETDKARYNIGESVEFHLTLAEPIEKSTLLINYYFEGILIGTEALKISLQKSIYWSWQPPLVDYCGYLVEVFLSDNPNNQEKITIAVDVSSSWNKYPRYGFVSKYPQMTDATIDSVIKRLNRFHINGVQFYDWHNTHHDPLKGTVDAPEETWQDIANRTIYQLTVEKYINTVHKYNMKAMAYNLLYGAWSSGFQEGVQREWGLYIDLNHQEPFRLNMPDGWADDIYFMNPADPDWKNYIFEKMNKTFRILDFDGWHVDQIGDLGVLYTYEGDSVILKDTFTSFLSEAKVSLNTKLVMNAVAQYGWAEIDRAPVEFLYNEVWKPDSTFNDLVRILDQNRTISGKNTVLPAYMNYNKSSQSGFFNTPGILLTDAVIFSNGGAHLELGEHMLCHEYFPNDNLKMTLKLEKALVSYYDFSVAYQTLLRSPQLRSYEMIISSDEVPLQSMAQKGTVWSFSKSIGNKTIVHFINLMKVEDINWRDANGAQTEPDLIFNLLVNINEQKTVKSVKAISPDFMYGLPENVPYNQTNGLLEIKIPFLKYWTAIILEY